MTSELRPVGQHLGRGIEPEFVEAAGTARLRRAVREASSLLLFEGGYFARQENRLISRGAWTLQWRGGVVVPDAFEVGMARPPCAEPSES